MRMSFAQQIFKQILGFGEYGFPESHSASFALLVYISAWLKHYEPAAFCAALINSQPMGFYAPAQLVRDARAHGVEVRAVDVTISAVGLHAGTARGWPSGAALGIALGEASVARRRCAAPGRTRPRVPSTALPIWPSAPLSIDAILKRWPPRMP